MFGEPKAFLTDFEHPLAKHLVVHPDPQLTREMVVTDSGSAQSRFARAGSEAVRQWRNFEPHRSIQKAGREVIFARKQHLDRRWLSRSAAYCLCVLRPNCPFRNLFWKQARPWVEAGDVQLRHVMVGMLRPDSAGKSAALLAAEDQMLGKSIWHVSRAVPACGFVFSG